MGQLAHFQSFCEDNGIRFKGDAAGASCNYIVVMIQHKVISMQHVLGRDKNG